MAESAKDRAFEGKGSSLVRRELNRGGNPLFQMLVDVVSLQLEPIVVVPGRDHELHMIALLDADNVRLKFVLLGGYLDFIRLAGRGGVLLGKRLAGQEKKPAASIRSWRRFIVASFLPRPQAIRALKPSSVFRQ